MSIVYLVPVFIAAMRLGLVPALAAAVAGVAASAYFFYPPIYSFRIADPQHILDLVLFVMVAVVISRLATSYLSVVAEARMRQETDLLRDPGRCRTICAPRWRRSWAPPRFSSRRRQ